MKTTLQGLTQFIYTKRTKINSSRENFRHPRMNSILEQLIKNSSKVDDQ